jgi:hypothetical protein
VSAIAHILSPATSEGQLRQAIADLQQQIDSLRAVVGVRVILDDLHDAATGRLDAQKTAEYMGVPLKRLTDGLGLSYKAVHRNPHAEAWQEELRPVKRSLEILDEFFRKPELARAWLNTPHPDLDGDTALETILQKRAEAVLTILENARSGVPV